MRKNGKPLLCGGHGSRSARAEIIERGLARLKDAGLKSTRGRRLLLEAIVKTRAPFSVDELFQNVSGSTKVAERFDLVTVYRTLATFSELGLLEKIELDDGLSRYELASEDGGHHHHHFVCTGCRKIEPVDACEIATQERALRARGYSVQSHRLEFFGLCPECRP